MWRINGLLETHTLCHLFLCFILQVPEVFYLSVELSFCLLETSGFFSKETISLTTNQVVLTITC